MSKQFIFIMLLVVVILVGCGNDQGTIVITTTPEVTTQQPTSELIPTATIPVQSQSTPTQETSVILNNNSGLLFEKCELKHFTTAQWGRDYYYHCNPAGYTIYETSCDGIKIDIDYTGAGYSFALGGRCGFIGFESSPMVLPNACIQIQVNGNRFVYGPDNYNLRGFISLAGSNGRVLFHPSPLRGNGNYETNFYVSVNNRDSYTIAVFFDMHYPTMTGESFAQINNFYVREVTPIHCELAPEI